ncbi:hypothetical protein TWF718_002779 [Orbilia javanica]|uniref:Uncharacterized protein n=1 Tax=Orbilia javanica TaxID=47235 RepID=A0AAN8MLE4_9PEZI
MAFQTRSKYYLIYCCFIFLNVVKAIQVSAVEFAEEVSRNNHTYIQPLRKTTQSLVKLATVTYPLTGNEPGWEGQETVRGHVFDATNSVDAIMKNFVAGLNVDPNDATLSPPALQVVLKYMQLRAAFLDYLEASVATDPHLWSFDFFGALMPMDIWVLIGRLRDRATVCCAANVHDSDSKTFQWVFNGVYDEEAELWTMKPDDAGQRVKILGAMIDGLEDLKVPVNELIEEIKAISVENEFPVTAYESLPKIVGDLEVIIQAFASNLRSIRLNVSGLFIEFTNRFDKEE